MTKLATTLKDITKDARQASLILESKRKALEKKQMKITDEKASALRRQKEENERKQKEKEKMQKLIISNANLIYTKILNAAWSNRNYAVINLKYSEFQKELKAYNLDFFDHLQKINKVTEIIEKFKDIINYEKENKLRIFDFKSNDITFYFYEKDKILIEEIFKLLNLKFNSIQNLKKDVTSKWTTIKENIKFKTGQLNEKKNYLENFKSKNQLQIINDSKLNQSYENAKIKIQYNLDYISGRYQSAIINKNLSVFAKADILRNIYKESIENINFDIFDNVEIINLIREAANREPTDISSLRNNQKINLQEEIEQIELNIYKIEKNINAYERNLEILDEKIKKLITLEKKVRRLRLVIINSNKELSKFNEFLKSKEIQIKNNGYVSQCLVKISKLSKIREESILAKLEAISFIRSIPGKKFKEKLILALESTAKKSINRMSLLIRDQDEKLEIKINTSVFTCKIQLKILMKLLKDTGLIVRKIKIQNDDALNLSW